VERLEDREVLFALPEVVYPELSIPKPRRKKGKQHD